MNDLEVQRMADIAGGHFWFRGTRRVILSVARRAAARPLQELDIADIGCGPGTTLSWLPPGCRAIGLDRSALALRIARERVEGARLIACDAQELPLAPKSVDLAFCLDLLEHLPEPERAVAEISRILRPGGVLVATVPALPWLTSPHDHALGHLRRYRLRGFRELLGRAGLEVRRISYYNTFLFPPVAAVRLLRRTLGRRPARDQEDAPAPPPTHDLFKLPAPINRLLEEILASERHLLGRLRLPLGVSLIAEAHRP